VSSAACPLRISPAPGADNRLFAYSYSYLTLCKSHIETPALSRKRLFWNFPINLLTISEGGMTISPGTI